MYEWQDAGNAKALPTPAAKLADVTSLDCIDNPILRDLNRLRCR
jgi:hypothetical protein